MTTVAGDPSRERTRECGPLPPELRRWNRGALLFTPLWGPFDARPSMLWALRPGPSLLLPFIASSRGNAWAWSTRRWTGVGAVRRSQRVWAILGVAVAVPSLLALSLLALSLVGKLAVSIGDGKPPEFTMSFRVGTDDEAEQVKAMAEAALRASPAAHEMLGTPLMVTTGSGSQYDVNGSGEASYGLHASGPKASGTAVKTGPFTVTGPAPAAATAPADGAAGGGDASRNGTR